jgi:transposase
MDSSRDEDGATCHSRYVGRSDDGKEETEMNPATIAVDLSKSVFEVAVSEKPGRVSERHRFSRDQFQRFVAERPPATILLEACGSAHYWGRTAERYGHRAVLLPPHITRPYVHRDKTDRTDAKGLLEAYRNEDVRQVPVKTEAQQALAAMHRLRSAWMATRTARINLVRAMLREFGFTIPLGAGKVRAHAREILDQSPSSLPSNFRDLIESACDEIRELDDRIRKSEADLRRLVKQTPVAERLCTIPGVGLITATALVAFVGDIRRFRSGRRLASYLGLTPREHSSGRIRRLGAISKRGNTYVRMLLIHGARAVIWAAKRRKRTDRLRVWALQIQEHRGHNKAATALANKLARIVWAVWSKGTTFQEAAVA